MNNELHDLSLLSQDELIKSFVEIEVNSTDDFLKIKETLTRMGVTNTEETKLFQSCHIFHKRGKYYIVSFKELYALDGKHAEMSDEDYARRNTIANNLESWGMLKLINPEKSKSPILGGKDGLTIIPFGEKGDWQLQPKYNLGKKKKAV